MHANEPLDRQCDNIIFNLADVLFMWNMRSSDPHLLIPPENFHQMLNSATWYEYEEGKIEEEECYVRLSSEYTFPTSDISTTFQACRASLRADREMFAFLQDLKASTGVWLFAMSNIASPDWEVLKTKVAAQDWALFDDIFTSASTDERKPNLGFYQHVISSTGSNPWGKLHRLLQGHTNWVCAAAFNMETMRIVTGSYDSTIHIWDAKTGKQLLVLDAQVTVRRIDAMAFSEDGRMVLSRASMVGKGEEVEDRLDDDPLMDDDSLTDDDSLMDDDSGTVKVWDASNGALLASLSETHVNIDSTPSPHSACFSPCGSYVVASASYNEALLWRTSDWSCIAKVSGGGARVTQVAISPDGRVLCWRTEVGTVFFHRIHDLISANQD